MIRKSRCARIEILSTQGVRSTVDGALVKGGLCWTLPSLSRAKAEVETDPKSSEPPFSLRKLLNDGTTMEGVDKAFTIG